jgi:very-short-patch-repair endonuclease
MRTSDNTERAESRLARVAKAQWGVFTRAQALAAGIAAATMARRIEAGLWVRVLPRVYRAASTPESWNQRLMAACLFAGGGAVVSHRTAARLHGLEGLSARTRDEPIELTVPLTTQARATGLLVRRSRKLDRIDRSKIDGVPVTTLPRTLIDLSATLDDRHLSVALDSGLARHPDMEVAFFQRALRRLRTKGRPGTAALARLLDERAPDAPHLDSALERRFVIALRRAGLPTPKAHYDVIHDGRRIMEADFAYVRERIAIELHGASIHRQKGVWEDDQEKTAELGAAGWLFVPITWKQLDKSEKTVMDRIARTLAQRRQ